MDNNKNIILKRKLYDELLQWKRDKSHECLLLKGARQVGKTYLIKEQFGKDNYQSVIVIDFFEHPEYCEIFAGSLNADSIYQRISLFISNARFIPHQTLIFLDEIQHCPEARTALKFLALDDRYDVIASGSLLGISYKNVSSIPVGYERILTLYSLDFEEFLWARGYQRNAICNLKEYFDNQSLIPNEINKLYHCLLREYMVIGGMPAVVKTFLATNNFNDVYMKQVNILNDYQDDMIKYAPVPDRNKIRDCYYSLPRQLAKEYTKFQYSMVAANGSARKYINALNWLIDAGIVAKVFNVSTPLIPLNAYEKNNQFKIYGTDIGLVTALFGRETQGLILKKELIGPAKGGIFENLIFDFLNKKRIHLHYYKKDDNTQEIEFLLESNEAVIPIEVKSNRGLTLSLDSYLDIYHPPYAYKLCGGNIGRSGKKITLPHYLGIFI